MRKILITLIAVCAMLFAFSMINASAATEGVYTYTVSNGEATITYCNTSASGRIVIPDKLGGCPVTSIGDNAFKKCSSLVSVTIGDNVTSIGDNAFRNCSSLVSVTIGDSVTSIGVMSFYYCDSLTSITLPNSVTSIGDWAFSCCNSLTSITIPDSVTSIGRFAFSDCNSLTSVTIPDSVTSIGDCAFSECDGLETIIIDDNNPYFCLIDGVLFSKDMSILICYLDGKTETEYIIPNGVTSIRDYAFRNCNSLTNITIPNSVTSIGECAFIYCSNLRIITIPNNVKSIGDSAFQYCSSLVSITIPNSVTNIGNSVVSSCDNLKDVYYTGTESEWNKISIGSSNKSLTDAIRFTQKEQEEYRINEITIKDMSGNSLQAIPTGIFLATVSFTNVSSSTDTVIILAQYTDTGEFKGLMYIQTEDVPTGSTIKLSIPVDNSKGDVAKLKAFCWESFASLIPMGNSASFPAE